MTQFDIIRPLTDVEKAEMISVDSVEFLSAFLKELAKVQAKYQKQYLPYDSYNARQDFEEYSAAKARSVGTTMELDDSSYKLEFDFEKYGKLDRFEFLERRDAKTVKLKDGMMQEVNIGARYRFKCNPRGSKISLFIPAEGMPKFEKWLKANFTDKKVEQEVKVEDSKDDSKE